MPGMSNTQLGVRHSRHPASGTGIQPGTPSQRAKILNAMPGCQMPGCWMPDAECRESLRPLLNFVDFWRHWRHIGFHCRYFGSHCRYVGFHSADFWVHPDHHSQFYPILSSFGDSPPKTADERIMATPTIRNANRIGIIFALEYSFSSNLAKWDQIK